MVLRSIKPGVNESGLQIGPKPSKIWEKPSTTKRCLLFDSEICIEIETFERFAKSCWGR